MLQSVPLEKTLIVCGVAEHSAFFRLRTLSLNLRRATWNKEECGREGINKDACLLLFSTLLAFSYGGKEREKNPTFS